MSEAAAMGQARARGEGGETSMSEETQVNHPKHYNRGRIEVIRAIHQYAPDFSCGNALKYLCRAGDKPGADILTDLQKAAWYLRDAVTEERKHWTERPHYFEPTTHYLPSFSIIAFLDDQGLTGNRRCAAQLLMEAGEKAAGDEFRLPFLEVAYGYLLKAIEEAEAARGQIAAHVAGAAAGAVGA